MGKIVLLLLFTFSLFASNVDKYAEEMGFERDYKTAIAKAKAANKPLMMVLGADYCPWCRKFERKTLSSTHVKSYVNHELITLIVDKKYDIESFPKKFQTYMTPKVFFINPSEEKSFYETVGYIKKTEFLQELKDMKKLYKGQ